MAEFALIRQVAQRVVARPDVVLGIGDDAALLHPVAGMQLAIATDTLNAGVHFPPETAPGDIGWKALAVNLSDLAAMGALPAWASVALSLPDADAAWVEAFMQGFDALAVPAQLALIGGDTTRGPLSVTVSVVGYVEPGTALRRDGAQAGDDVWVSGVPGEAAAALALWQAGKARDAALQQRLDRPVPRNALGRALRGLAHACIDVSDGLWADLQNVCTASGLGACLQLDALPVSPALRATCADDAQRLVWQCSGGDDYELCFTAAPAQRTALQALARKLEVPLTCIGYMQPGTAVEGYLGGRRWQPPRSGYQHFAG